MRGGERDRALNAWKTGGGGVVRGVSNRQKCRDNRGDGDAAFPTAGENVRGKDLEQKEKEKVGHGVAMATMRLA